MNSKPVEKLHPEILQTEEAALALSKLGHPVRLCIVQYLVQAGEEGLAVGEIQSLLGIPGSTLSHHISHLLAGGLITQERQSRVLRCFVNFDKMNGLVTLLTDKCCAGVDLTEIE